jgi:FabA-like domain
VLDRPMVWKYRGQILPGHTQMKIEVNVTRVEEFDDRVILEGDASLWADAVRIYEVRHAAVCVMESA